MTIIKRARALALLMALLLALPLVPSAIPGALAQDASLPQLPPHAAPVRQVQTNALPVLDTTPAFDAEAATNAYLAKVSGAARARSDAYFDGGIWQNIEKNMPDLFASTLKVNPTGKFVIGQEVANGVVFISSPLASRISGTNLVIDGALTVAV